MKIAILARGLTRGGVGRCIENILTEFNSGNFEHDFHVLTDDPSYVERCRLLKVHFIPPSNILIWDYLLSLFRLHKIKPDVVLYPKNVIPITHHWWLKAKKVNIVHDLAYFDNKLKEYKFFDTLYMKIFMGWSCLVADKTIAVSKHTKKDIVNILGTPEKKICVIYEGVEKKFRRETDLEKLSDTLCKFKIKKPFLFYCGSLSPRKNMLRVMQAFQQLKDQIPHNIYLAGGQSWNDREVTEYISRNLSNRVFRIGHLTDAELIVLYSTADLFLYPSLYEGFGLPILEAQACGCPVLTSNRTSCPEIAGDNAAVIVDPFSVKDISDNLLTILQNQALSFNISRLGSINVKNFDWTTSVKKIVNVVENL
ncbi:MAG TPA: glycosyltransferase family 1 protein [Candidatus Paceibacterota bacterium]|nr:glycosyltransferase family 1 protein [Candidatus Paceibacterota bacterium]